MTVNVRRGISRSMFFKIVLARAADDQPVFHRSKASRVGSGQIDRRSSPSAVSRDATVP